MSRNNVAKIEKLILAWVLGWMLAVAMAHAQDAEQDDPFGVTLGVGLFSDYMFRGQNLYDGFSIQPSADASYDSELGTFGGAVWMHLSGEEDRDVESFTEIDATLSYAIAFDPVSIRLAQLWYTYPDSGDEITDTNEVILTLALDDSELTPFALNPTYSISYDYREFDYYFHELTFSHEFGCSYLGEWFNLTPFVTLGFTANAEKVYADNGLVYASYGVSSLVEAGGFQILPTIAYSDKIDEATVNQLWFGATISRSY